MWSFPLPQNVRFDFSTCAYCNLCNAVVVHSDVPNHEQFHQNYVRKEDAMSNVKWCDPGNHAFKANIPGSQSFSGTTTDDNGLPVTMQMDACPNHAFNAPSVSDDAVRKIGRSSTYGRETE